MSTEEKKFASLAMFRPDIHDNNSSGVVSCLARQQIPRELFDHQIDWESTTGIWHRDAILKLDEHAAQDRRWRPRGTTWLAVTQQALLAKLGRSESDFVAQLCAELGVEGGERTILVEIAKLKAKIDDRVAWDKRLKDGTVTCKGFMRFFTGCGQCVRCKEEVHALLTENAELENERNSLRARVEKASEQSEVARLKRSVSVYVEELQKLVE